MYGSADGTGLLFQLVDGLSDHRDRKDSDSKRSFHAEVCNVVIDRPGKCIEAFRRIFTEKDDPGEYGTEISAEQSGQITEDQAEFSGPDQTGKSQRSESKRIIQEHLDGMDDIRIKNQIDQSHAHPRHHSSANTVKIRADDDGKHAESGNGTALGHAEQNDLIERNGQRNQHCRRYHRFGIRLFFAVRNQDAEKQKQDGGKRRRLTKGGFKKSL